MNHYVYIVTNLMNGKKYIGKRSCKCKIEKDSYMGSGYALARAKRKYGVENFEKKILLVCDTEEEAYEEEKKAIELVRAWENTMYYNISGGGAGFGSGEGHPCYGKLFSCEHRKKIALANMRRIYTDETRRKIGMKSKGRKHTEESRKKMGEKRRGLNNHNSRQVVCLNTKKIFESVTQAEKFYGVDHSQISATCRGKQKSAGKLNGIPIVWKYLEDYKKMTDKEIEYLCNKALNNRYGRQQKVICLNTNEVFNTVTQANNKYKLGNGQIAGVCKGKNKSAGKHPVTGEKLKWMYYEDYENKYEKIDKEIV